MQLTSLIKKLDGIDKPKSSAYLYEGLNTSNKKSVFLWESAGKKLIEANLTVDQINQIFTDVEQTATASGSNRTLIGKGKDAASAVNKAWEDLKTKVQNSGPIKNVDAMYDQAAEKLKQATGGDQGVMKYVQMYRDFAKKHPIAQSFIYAALIAAAGISGAGLGGAAALGLFKMTDKLLQGEKFSSAAYQGAKTGALAYGASKVGDVIKDKFGPYGSRPGENEFVGKDVYGVKPGENDFVGQTGADSDMVYKPDMRISPDTGARYDQGGTFVAKGGEAITNSPMTYQQALEKAAKYTDNPLRQKEIARTLMKGASARAAGANESVNLTHNQINLIFEHVSDSIILEGIWDSIKGAAGKAASWAQTKGANLTTKVTADKLQQSWKAAGSPTDSEEVKKVLQSAGVDTGIIDQAYTKIGISTATPDATEPDNAAQPTVDVGTINKSISKLPRTDLEKLQQIVNDALLTRSK